MLIFFIFFVMSVQFSSVAQSCLTCLTLCDPMDCSMPGLPVHHQLWEFTQTHVYWVGDAISSSVISFSSCLQSFPALGSFQMSQFFTSVGQSIGASASSSFRPMIIQYSGLISFRIDWFDLLAVQGTHKTLLQHHNSNSSNLWCSVFFMVQLSHLYMTTGKNHSDFFFA